MTTFYNHLYMFYMVFSMFVISFVLSVYSTFIKISFFLSFDVFSVFRFHLPFRLYLDYMALWFITVILLISSVIMVYSYFYMSPYLKSVYFLWTTFLFIVSILFVVTMSRLFYVILGWDGLGVVSFFLIVYYQNSSSILSGLFTLLINRMGDGFFLVAVAAMSYFYSDFFSFSSQISSSLLVPLLLLTFMTKRALYPFSSWLPMAMAAPTPISALVHSSTLVTAGLYLMLRFSYLLYASVFIIKLLVAVGLFTAFYAGLNTIFETDLKKLIALSTLSHLGFIAFSFGSGLLLLSFFHLLVHALFKSLLFMTMGDIIINLNHSQDIRYLSMGASYTPFSVYTMYVSLLRLLGVPNISGYFSKDLVLELFSYSGFSFFLVFVLYSNVLLTYFYTYQLFFYSYSTTKVVPFQIFHPQGNLHVFLMLLLGLVSVLFGKFFLSFVYSQTFFLVVPLELKFLPLIFNFLIFSSIVLFISFPVYRSSLISLYFSNMMFLTLLLISVSTKLYHKTSFTLVKDMELGFLNNLLHLKLTSLFSTLVASLFSFHKHHYFYLTFFLLFLFFSIY